MAVKFEISEILNKFDLKDREKKNLGILFEFTNYLLDDEKNLTKTMALAKNAKDQLITRLKELFEGSLSDIITEDE